MIQIPDTLRVGRGHAMRAAFLYFVNRNTSPVIVEVGVARDEQVQAMYGDGWSSVLWAWYAQQHADAAVHLIDISDASLTACRNIITRQLATVPENVHLHCGDAVEIIRGQMTSSPIGLLYLDGSDDPQEMLDQLLAAEPFLAKDATVLMDDIPVNWYQDGKGQLLIPYLLKHREWWSQPFDFRADAAQMWFVRNSG